MKKLFAILSLFLLFFSANAQDNVAPVINIKKEIIKRSSPGEYEVKITIECSNTTISGFASYKEKILPGSGNITVTEISNSGASFQYTENEIKFLWTAISLTGKLMISYLVQDAGSAKLDVLGSFKYVHDNVICAQNLKEGNVSFSEEK